LPTSAASTQIPYIRNKYLSPLNPTTITDETEEELEGKWIGRGLRAGNSLRNYLTARNLMFKVLEDGKYSVSAPSLPVGDKIPFRQSYNFEGTRYNPGSVSRITGRNLLRGALSKSTWIVALGTSLIGNIYDFTVGKNKGKSFQEFAVSTGVDTVMTVGTGLVAATGVVLVAGAFGLTLTAAPVIIAASIVALFIGLGLDQIGAGDWVKKHVNNAIDCIEEGTSRFVEKVKTIPNTLKGIDANLKIIGDVVTDRVREGITNAKYKFDRIATDTIQHAGNFVKDTAKVVGETVQHIGETVQNTANNIANGAKKILGGIFGGG
jgi:hypothetical protein